MTEHHRMEDVGIFHHLRRSQRDLKEALDRLHEEHHATHDVLESVDAALVRLAEHPGDYGPVTRPGNCSPTPCCPTSPTKNAN
ncbi:hypothetical protein ACFXJ5_39160 [Streptomyces sp. NPDC059373]